MTDLKPEGKFIVIEGIDGAGKSTLVKRLCDADPRSFGTAQPWKDDDSMLINWELAGAAEYAHNRRMLLEKIIIPRLDMKGIVFCDRHVMSSLVYQGEFPFVYKLNSDLRKPDWTLWIDTDPRICYTRIVERGEVADYADLERLAIRYRLAEDFMRSKGERVYRLDGSRTETEVYAAANRIIYGGNND